MFGNISIWQLLIVLAIIVLLFGTKKLRGIGSDLGSAVKGFRNSVKDDAEARDEQTQKAHLADNSDTAKDKQHADSSSTKDKV